MPIADPRNRAISERRESNAHCDLRLRWKVASDLRFRAAISEPKIPSFCGISGDLAPSTQKSLAIAIVRFWCAKHIREKCSWSMNSNSIRRRRRIRQEIAGNSKPCKPYGLTGNVFIPARMVQAPKKGININNFARNPPPRPPPPRDS